MKKKLRYLFPSILAIIIYISIPRKADQKMLIQPDKVAKKGKKSEEQKRLFAQERLEHELNFQRNPHTGEIPLEEKKQELQNAINAKDRAAFSRTSSISYSSRGPSNFGGRTRAVRVDISDATSNTILAGGVSSGLFRTTNGGTSWTKVSPNDEIHNVTAIAQDPRAEFQNIWYYATGEWSGNSASLGNAFFRGQGIWKSTDNGATWSSIAVTSSTHEVFDDANDYISALEVSPINGDLMIAAYRTIYRYDGTSLTAELTASSGESFTDVVINSAGRVFAAIGGGSTEEGVWTSSTGNGSWTRIAQNGTPTNWSATGRIVLAHAPSNNNILYALFENGGDNESGEVEADLWHYNLGTGTWTDYTSKMPDEAGGDLAGNDPFSIQGGYDLVVSVKPDDEDFVVIGGTNAYKIDDIVNDATFKRIGGYISNLSYASYTSGLGDNHHADIHALQFDPNDSDILFSGTDGGVHKTISIGASTVSWTSLNNNYLTYQYYHVAIDSQTGSDIIFGGAQDNGTTYGGTDIGLSDNTTMAEYYGGDGVAVGLARRAGGTEMQFYYGSQNGNIRTNYPSGFRSLIPDGSDSQFITYFYLDPDNTNALYYAGLTKLYKTNDAENVTTSTWDDLGIATGNNLRTFATSRGTYNAASSYLLIGDEAGQILRLDDPQNETAASNAVNITPSGATTTSGTIVSGLAIHPTNPDIVLATYANYGITNIFITTNATAASPTWTEVERNLSAHSIRSAAITVVDGEIIYFVGTARGLYSSTDPTSIDWQLQGGAEMGLPVVSSLAYRPSDNKMLVGTHGNGMFEATVVSSILSTKDVTNNELGASIYPNPVQNELNITSSKIDFGSEIAYQISDLTGKLIQKGRLSNKKMDVSKLNKGLYIIQLESEGLKGSLKFLKE